MPEEPLYMKAARGNVQHQIPSLPWVVEALLKRIEILEAAIRPTSDSFDPIAKLAESGAILSRDGWVVPADHERWLDIDWDDNGGIRGYKTEHCNCPTPWRHRP